MAQINPNFIISTDSQMAKRFGHQSKLLLLTSSGAYIPMSPTAQTPDFDQFFSQEDPDTAITDADYVVHEDTWARAADTGFTAPVARIVPFQEPLAVDPTKQINRFIPFVTNATTGVFNARRYSPLPAGDEHYSDWHALSEAEDGFHPYAEENVDPLLRTQEDKYPEVESGFQPCRTANTNPTASNRFHPYQRASGHQVPPGVEMTRRSPWNKDSSMHMPVEDVETHMADFVEKKTLKYKKRKSSASRKKSQVSNSMRETTISPAEASNFSLTEEIPNRRDSASNQTFQPDRTCNRPILPKPVTPNKPIVYQPIKPKKQVRFSSEKLMSPRADSPTNSADFVDQVYWDTLFESTMHSPEDYNLSESGQETLERSFQQVSVSPTRSRRNIAPVNYADDSNGTLSEDDAAKAVKMGKKNNLNLRKKRGKTST